MLFRTFPALTLTVAVLAAACSAGEDAGAPAALYGTPELLWARGGCAGAWCQTGWYGSPAVADLDADGTPEIVWAASDLVALRAADGAVAWRASGGGRAWASPVVADLDGDGDFEVAVGRGGGTLAVHAADGRLVRTLSPFGTAELRSLVAADLDGDGTVELVAGRGAGAAAEQVTVIDASGATVAGWPAKRAGEAGHGWGLYNQNLAVADLDGDGAREVIAPSDVHYVMAFSASGAQLPAHARYGAGKVWSQVGVHVDDAVDLRGSADCGNEHRPNFASSPASVGDLDGDGTPEIVIVGNVQDCGASPYRSLAHLPFVLEADRSRWKASARDWTAIPAASRGAAPRSEDWDVIETAVPNPVLADLDGDGTKEILHASYDGRVHAWWLDRTAHGAWPFTVPGPGLRFASEPAVADLDGDGRAEVIVTTWPQKAGGGTGALLVLDADGRLVREVALPSPASGSWNGALGAPSLANLDDGPELEVVVGTVASGVAVYRIPGSVSTGIRWGTGRGNVRRDGAAP